MSRQTRDPPSGPERMERRVMTGHCLLSGLWVGGLLVRPGCHRVHEETGSVLRTRDSDDPSRVRVPAEPDSTHTPALTMAHEAVPATNSEL